MAGPMDVSLKGKYESQNPWPDDGSRKVLFILDTRNSFEQELLRNWIRHHNEGAIADIPHVNLDLRDEQHGINSAPLVSALNVPADTLVIPLRVTWLPSQEAINSGPRLRDMFYGDPRDPCAARARSASVTCG